MAGDQERTRHAKTDRRAVYVISVAAELAGVHPQTLRIYEQKGLVRPQRTSGNSRRYSEEDIARLRRVQALTHRGVNLAGVKRIIELQEELAERGIPMPRSRISVQIVPIDDVLRPGTWEADA